jgi:hypothetical protein
MMHRRSPEVRNLTSMMMRGATTPEMVRDEQMILNSGELLQKESVRFLELRAPLDALLLLDVEDDEAELPIYSMDS